MSIDLTDTPVNAVNNTNDRAREMQAEQIRLVYKPLISVFVANALCSVIVVAALWHLISHLALTAWFGAMMLATAFRIGIYISFRRHFSVDKTARYARYYMLEAGMHGLLWGIAGVLFFPQEDLVYQLFLVVMLVGVGAAAPVTKSAYLPGFYAFFPVSVLPLVIMLFTLPDFLHLALGVSGIAYFVIVTHYAMLSNKNLKETLFLRFENLELVERLREQKDEAERANLAKSTFLAAASHDLRQPLHALTLFTSVLDELVEESRTRKVVEKINDSVHALEKLFNALLDISRLDAGVIKVRKSIFALQPIFKRLEDEFVPQADNKGLAMSWPKDDVWVLTDPTLLEQILRNYIANAIRYTEKGEVSIGCDADGENLTINVRDTGIGIPDADKEIIFEEFRQLGNPERDRGKGLGLGLAIVKRVAKLLGHEIGVESQPESGSRFFITVKQAMAGEENAALPFEEDQQPESVPGTLIVVIDDEASVREGMQSLLQLWGCDVITSASKEEAIAELQKRRLAPHGIIADYRLRDNQTGIEAIHDIHAAYNAHIPALVVTGDIAVEQLRVANDSGFQVLHKPVAPLKLRAFLQNVRVKNNGANSL